MQNETDIQNSIHSLVNNINEVSILNDILNYTKLKGIAGIHLFESYLSQYMIPESSKSITYKSFIKGLDLSQIKYVLDNMERKEINELIINKWEDISNTLPKEFVDICINDKQSFNNVTTGKGESALCLFYKGSQNRGAESGDISINNHDIEVKGKSWLIGKSGKLPDVPKDTVKTFAKLVNNIIHTVYPNVEFKIPPAKVKSLPRNLYHFKNILKSYPHISDSVINTCLMAIMNHIDELNDNNNKVIDYVMNTVGNNSDYKYITNLYQYKYLKEYSKEFDYMAIVTPETYQFISSHSIQNKNVFFDVTSNSTDSSSRGGGYQGRYGDYIIDYSYK